MEVEIKSLKHWQEIFDELELAAPVPLFLTQTYKEWLQENPNGYTISSNLIVY